MTRDRGGNVLETTHTSLNVLDRIKELEGATSTELTKDLGIASSTLHAHLSTLRELGYVEKHGNEYHVGLKLLKFGEHVKHRGKLHSIAKAHVHKMANDTQFEADFLVNENGKLYLLYGEIGAATDPNFQIGSTFYMHSTGTGKAILSGWPRGRVERVIDKHGLPKQTEETITTRERLYEELDRTREQGYGVNDEECMEGYRTIGAVVHDPLGNVIGGLGIGGPTYRVDDRTIEETMAPILFDAVEEFENQLTEADAMIYN
jgi:DNA-binding IclR family transcriptional regulator